MGINWYSTLMLTALVLLCIDFVAFFVIVSWLLYGWILSKSKTKTIETAAEVIFIPDPDVSIIDYESQDTAFEDDAYRKTDLYLIEDEEFNVPVTEIKPHLAKSDSYSLDTVSIKSNIEFNIPLSTSKTHVVKCDSKDVVSLKEIDAGIYRKESQQVETIEENIGPCLCLGIYFYKQNNELSLCLSKARHIHIPDAEVITISVILLSNPEIKYTGCRSPPNPEFNCEFLFNISQIDLINAQVKFNIWRIDDVSRKMPYGESILNMADYVNKETSSTNISIKEKWLGIVKRNRLTNESGKGLILLSTVFLPTANRVNVNVLKAKCLAVEEFDKGIYVKVSAVVDGTVQRVIKSMKTSNKGNGSSVTFNESVHFDLAPITDLQLSRMSVIVSVYSRKSRGLAKRSGKRLMGRAIIGSSSLATPEGKAHWNNMILGDKKTVTEWHDLL